MELFADSEVGELHEVLVGSARNWRPHPPINVVQRHFYQVDPPDPDRLARQHERFVERLAARGVAIRWVDAAPTDPPQLFTRDVAFVAGDRLVVGALKEAVRAHERARLASLESELDGRVLEARGVVEGGDVLLDGERLYVGLSERTDPAGLAWLTAALGERFEIVPLQLAPPFLHLDTVLNRVGRDLALIHPDAFEPAAVEALAARHGLIPVDAAEQFALATNVLSLDPATVVVDPRHHRVNDALRARGLELIEIEFDEVAKLGGAFRCATCPLWRAGMGDDPGARA